MFLTKNSIAMTLDILICTIDEGIKRVPNVLIPKEEGIRYVISMQYTDEKYFAMIPEILRTRDDVTLLTLQGRGLSRNRNNALAHATGDILLIADDDNRYTSEGLRQIIETYECNQDASVICFMSESYSGEPMKKYPTETMSYEEAFKQGYYTTSFEMTMRNHLDILFDERFGLGSKMLCAGEEEVFMKDVIDAGYEALFIPKVIVRSDADTTGTHFVGNKKMQISKGATFRYLFGTREAIWRSIKEALHHLIHEGANPFPILRNMLKGIWILQS